MTRRNSAADRKRCFDDHAHGDPPRLRCHACGWEMDPRRDRWEAEHIIPLAIGGTELAPICSPCHLAKTRRDIGEIAKSKRVASRALGIARSAWPMPGSRASGWRKRMDGTVERRG